MTPQEIVKARDNVVSLLEQCKLKEAFMLLRELLSLLNTATYADELGQLETAYHYMVHYMVDGYQDPERKTIYNRLLLSTYMLTDKVAEALQERHSHTLYYSKQRAIKMRTDYSIAQALDQLDKSISNLSLSQLLGEQQLATDDTLSLRRTCEGELSDLFIAIWTLPPDSESDYKALAEALAPQRYDEQVLSSLVAAVTLNLLQHYSEPLLHWLLDAYALPAQQVKQRALCGALLTLFIYRERVALSTEMRLRIETLCEDADFSNDARNIYIQFIKTRETEKILQKLTDELLPEMMKIDPSIYRKIGEDSPMDAASLDKNPEWMELFESSPLANKLKEINELQQEGADLFMGTFSQLKRYPFFDQIANWFLPFSPSHTTLATFFEGTAQEENFKRTLSNSVFLCNSDKYSFIMSILQLPKEQRTLMMSQFDVEAEEMKRVAEDEFYIPLTASPEHISNQYIQDLYRFFRLFKRKEEFVDPFTLSLNLYQVEVLQPLFEDSETLRLVAEYYFRKEHYSEALLLFEKLAETDFEDTTLYQKIGYCYEMLDNYEEALESLLKADMISPQNIWTWRHIATCYRRLNRVESALSYYHKVATLAPDNLAIQLHIGHCYLEMKLYDEALKHYFKVEYLATASHKKAWRVIAWCSFLLGKREQAQRYYDKLLAYKPTAIDYMNAAHVAFASNEIHRAIELYSESIAKDRAAFLKNFEQDTPHLLVAGVSSIDIHILLDKLLFDIK